MRLATRVGVVALVLGCLVAAVLSQSDRIGEIRWRFSPGWLGLCLLSLVAFELLHIEIWRMILRALGGKVEARRARAIWSATLLARYVPTSVLMAVGRVALCDREGVPKRVTLASTVYEFGLTVVASLAVADYLVLTLPWFDQHPVLRVLALALPVVGLVCLHPAVFHRVADYALRRFGRESLPLSLGFAEVLRFGAFYLFSFGVAGCSVLAMAHVLYPVGGGDASAVAIASHSLGYVAAIVGFLIPGSLGAREAGVALGLSAVVPAAVAVAVAIALRLLQTGVELTYAVVTAILARRGSESVELEARSAA